MVMIFQSEKPRKQLLEKGVVFTWRKMSIGGRKLGKDWATDKRGGTKIADILVFSDENTVYPIHSMLGLYIKYSGFDSVDEWINEILRVNRIENVGTAFGEIFCVIKRS